MEEDIFDQIQNYIFDMPDSDLRPRIQRAIDILDHIRRQAVMCDLFYSKPDNEWGQLAKGLTNLINERSIVN